MNLVQASRTSLDYCDVEKKDLHVCYTTYGAYINADTSDFHGIQRAIDLNLIPSALTDVVVSSRFLHALALFDTDHNARAFTAMRNPIERIISTFYYLQQAKWERQYDEKYKKMSLIEYIKSAESPSNWMVRWLTGKQNEKILTEDDLKFAKEIIQKKFLILLTEEMQTSFERLMKYMKWGVDEAGKQCLEENLSKVTRHNKNLHPDIEVGSEEYNIMKEKNLLDIELYNYAVELFSEQSNLLEQ